MFLMVVSTFKLPKSPCPKCGEIGRFIGMERDGSHRNALVESFECDGCGEYAIEKPLHKPNTAKNSRPARAAKPN